MAITFGAATSVVVTGGTSVTGTIPSGTTAASLLIAVASNFDNAFNNFTPNTPGDWTAITAATAFYDGANDVRQQFWYRFGTPANPATFSCASSYIDLAIIRYEGVDTTTPLDATATANGAGGTTTTTWTGLTTATNGAVILAYRTGYTYGLTGAPTGMTQRLSFDTTLYLFDETIAVAGATGNRTATSTAADNYAASLIALRPAAAVAGSLPPPRPRIPGAVLAR